MIQLYIGSQTLVLPLQEVFGAPDPDSAVISTRCQVLPITAKINTGHVPAVALEGKWKKLKPQSEMFNT